MAAIELVSLLWGHKEVKTSSVAGVYEGWTYRRPSKVTGGVGIHNEIYNASEKEIKYLTFTYVAYNQVGDLIRCTVKGEAEARGKLTGPIAPNETASVDWDVLWYNPTISSVAIQEILVQFMDGTEETVSGSEILKTSDENSVYYQKRGKAEREEALKRAEERKKCEEEREKEKARAKKRSKIIKLTVLGVVLAIIAGCVISFFVKQAQYDIDNFRVEITDKTNDSYNNVGVYVVFDFNVENKGKIDASNLKGILTVTDQSGNVLMVGNAGISDIAANAQTTAQVRFTMSRDEKSEALWNTEYENLTFKFEIESVSFEDGTYKTVEE